MKLPLFPLQTVFYPGETVPLHIFEERYRQLINDCREEAVTFGIPVYINKIIEFGTEVQLVEVVNTYDGGEMDIICVARQVFRVLTFENEMDGKLYAGGEVEFLESANDADESLRDEVIKLIEKLYHLMAVELPVVSVDKFNSYAFAHKMGLSFEQEYELLQLTNETERLLYIKHHLKSTIGVLNQINKTKAVIEMNGHFKNFDPLDFKDYEGK
ncbi:MAG: LON peptidase substrate-binding domain-containing protein [Croceitalea sp.]|nr:LON peptidase substrate-binding domain-containing protein [Croceitalea sp.]MBT8238791.1 LON peptidase substrate-binding domain-containing protein [Croceitalea sp.]NNC35770.1 LON peptidase substrate-binding domain-containing protein [Croceitalea sp.]NNL10041.1 LON peptidase substrate-binding domain-containing protein [Croceitalea sp.]NNM19441.1 LON peptidase substrate-binding domain-containing protein [Croceitalea sp.]